MQKQLLILIMVLAAVALYADERVIEVSEDGHLTVIMDEVDQPSAVTITDDIVPYGDQPDWSLNLRMQVGGLTMDDLDGDGDLDLAVGCYHSQSYPPYPDWRNFILYNNSGQLQSSPGWWSTETYSTTDVRIADFNGDGCLDIFAANGDFSFNPSTIHFNFSNDSIQTQAGWFSDDNCWSTCAAPCDFDHDGDIDVATSNQGVSPDPYRPVNIFVNQNGNLEVTPSWSSATLDISGYLDWGDYNNDGWEDLAVSKWANFSSCVYGNVAGAINPNHIFNVNTTNTQKGIGWSDVDADDYDELAVGASGMPTSLYPNNDGVLGSSPIWQSVNSYHGVQDLTWADVDGDGDEDLATVHFSTGHLRIYLNVNGVLAQTPSWQYDASGTGTAVTFGDINGDGLIDLVMGASGDPSVRVFYNTITSVDEQNIRPEHTTLACNYPNPFNAQTLISFYLETPSHACLQVYDLLGNQVTTLVDGFYGAGHHDVVWDGLDASGNQAATGVYFYRLTAGENIFTKKMMLVK